MNLPFPSSSTVSSGDIDLASFWEQALDEFQSANFAIERSLDLFVTSEWDESERFEFADTVEMHLVVLEGNLRCLAAEVSRSDLKEAGVLLNQAATDFRRLGMSARAEFGEVRISPRLHDLADWCFDRAELISQFGEERASAEAPPTTVSAAFQE